MHEIDLDNMFTYHPPKGDQPERYQKIRESGKQFAQTLIDNAPMCADLTAAIRKISEAVMTANAAIARNE